MKAKQKEN